MVHEYLDLLGTPFRRGARGPDAYDCYGLAIELFRRQGIALPEFTSPGTIEDAASLIADQEKRWRRVPMGTLGSLLTLRVDGLGAHVGVFVGGGRYVHTTEPTGVTTDRLINGNLRPLAAYFYE